MPSLRSQLGDESDLHYFCWAYENDPWLHVSSDGEHLVIASQWPIYFETYYEGSSSSAAWIEQLIENPPRIHLSVTKDLVNWDTTELLIPRPEGLHDSLHAAPSLNRLSVSEHGWVIELLSVIYINLFHLMPDDIKETATGVWHVRDGPTRDESTGEEGITIEWWNESTPQDEPDSRLLTWDELGTTYHHYDAYTMEGTYAYHPSFHYSASMFSASWGEDPQHSGLPDIGKCCNIIRTESGYVGIPDHSEAGYAPWWFSSAAALFSADGETWDEADPITAKSVWIPEIRAVSSGVLARGVEVEGQYLGEDAFYWIGSPDASEWREIELPEGTSLIEWLMAHDRAPVDWPHVAVQGDIVLRISGDGRVGRYVVPEQAASSAVGGQAG